MMGGHGLFVGHGPSLSSSSSSSTLSPLAQPFTVPKLRPATPPNTFNEHLDYVPSRPSLDNWLEMHPPTPASDPFPVPSTDIDSVRGSYGYFGSSLIGSDGTHLPSLDPTGCGFSYGQKTGSVAATSLLEAEPYYPQYPPAVHDKGNLGLKESTFGLQKTVAVAPLDGPSPSDYVQNLSGFGYNPVDWSGVGKDVELSWKRPSGKAVSYGSSLQKGGTSVEGFMAHEEAAGGTHGKGIQSSVGKIQIGSTRAGSEWLDSKYSDISEENTNATSYNMSRTSVVAPGLAHQEVPYTQLPDPTSPTEVWNPFNQNPASYDMFFREHETANSTIFYPPGLAYSSPAQAFCLPACGPSSTSVAIEPKNMRLSSCPMDLHYEEASGHISANVNVPLIQLNVPTKAPANTSRIPRHARKDDFLFVGRASPASANIKVPGVQPKAAEGNESVAAKTSTSNDPKTGNLGVGGPFSMNIQLPHFKVPKLVIGESSSSSKMNFGHEHPHDKVIPATVKISMPINAKAAVNNSSSHLERKSELGQPLSPVKITSPLNPQTVSDDYSNPNAKYEQELPCLKLPNVFSAPSTTGQGDSMQSSSETFDQFISAPAVDSPCWKGASASRRSPFGAMDAITTVAVEKGLEGPNNSNQHSQIPPINADDDAETTSSLKQHGCFTQSEVVCMEDSSVFSPTKSHLLVRSMTTNENGTPCSMGKKELGNCYVLPDSHSGCKTSEVTNLSQEDDITSASQPAQEAGTAEDAARNGPTNLHYCAGELGSNASSGAGLSSVITEMLGVSDKPNVDQQLPQLDVGLLVMMMFNMSELLRYSNALKEKDYAILRLVMDNLKKCVAQKVGFAKTIPEPFPLKVWKVMEESVHEQGEKHPQTLLYKNLWFEAEAALCSMKHELARLKIEKEKYEDHLAKGELSCPSLPLSVSTDHALPPVKSIGVATDSIAPTDAAGKPMNEKSTTFSAIGIIAADDMHSNEAKQSLTEKNDTVGDQVKHSSPIKSKEVNPMSPKDNAEAASPSKAKEDPTENVATVGDDVDASSNRGPVELNQSIMQVEDAESSVMARFRVLKSQIDNLSCLSYSVQRQQPVPIVTGGHVPHCLEERLERCKPWPFITDQYGDRCLEVGNGYEEQHLLTCIDENCLGCDVRRQNEMTKGFHLQVADEAAINSYMEGPFVNCFQAVGYESPSSDWEHVLKEELKW